MRAIANVNGQLSPLSEAKISINDRGFLYGDSIYEVTRTYNGIPFFLEEHFDRLENSARLAKMKISQSREELIKEISRSVKESGAKSGDDVFIRYTITRGEGPLDLDPATSAKTSYVIVVKELPKWKPEHYSNGMTLAIPTVVRNSPLALDPNIKSGNYLNNILAVADAKERGGDDALILSPEGKLTEASNSNIAFVVNGELHTPLHEPHTATGNLRGITRTLISELAKKINLKYMECPMFPEDISKATEAFVSSATREVMPVKTIILQNKIKKEFPSGGGELTKKLQKEYQTYVADYIRANKSKAWF